MKYRLSARTRWRLYRRLARYPHVSSFLRARRYDKREYLRQHLELRVLKETLAQVRGDRDVCWVESDLDDEPLVTVAIPTYNRPREVVAAVHSALGQTYENLEVLVVGDSTNSETADELEKVHDPRLRYINLPYQGIYPGVGHCRWLVAGVKPMNAALDLARGAWIVNCDDDDELLPDHVEALLRTAKDRRLEMVYSQAERIDDHGIRHVTGSEPIRWGAVVRGSVCYSLGLRFIRYEPECWRIRDPADWNLWKRMQLTGVRIGFLPVVTYRH